MFTRYRWFALLICVTIVAVIAAVLRSRWQESVTLPSTPNPAPQLTFETIDNHPRAAITLDTATLTTIIPASLVTALETTGVGLILIEFTDQPQEISKSWGERPYASYSVDFNRPTTTIKIHSDITELQAYEWPEARTADLLARHVLSAILLAVEQSQPPNSAQQRTFSEVSADIQRVEEEAQELLSAGSADMVSIEYLD